LETTALVIDDLKEQYIQQMGQVRLGAGDVVVVE